MKRMAWFLCILAGWLLADVAVAAPPWKLSCRYDNRVELVKDGETIATASPVFFDASWHSGRITKCVFDPKKTGDAVAMVSPSLTSSTRLS